MWTLLQDLRYGARRLLDQPGFTAVATLTLALGIGANAAIFSVVNGVLLRSLPYKEPERLMMLWEANDRVRNNHISHQNFTDWRAQQQSFEAISAYSGRWGGPETITGGSEPERAYMVSVYRDFFNVLGVAPIAGRVILPAEEQPGAAPVVVISHGFWQRRLGGNFDLTNKRLTIGDRSFNVIGVMPPGFSFPVETDLWVSKEQFGTDASSRSSHNYVGVARLKPNITREQAQAEMTAIARRIAQQDASDQQHNDVNVISIKDQMTGSIRRGLLILFGAVGCVLLIACANVANLTLARALGRRREIAIRSALGAARARIVRQLLTESLLLALAGGALGLLFAYWLVRTLLAFGPAIPRLSEIGVDGRAIAFTFGVSLLTSLLCGLAPALSASRTDLNESLKEGGRSAGGSSGMARSALVVAEVALTLVLLVGAGLLIRSLWRVMQIDPGFNPEGALTMQVSLPASEYSGGARKIAFYRQLFERLKSVPGVEAAGMVNNLPMGGVDINGQFGVAGRPQEQFGYAGYRVVNSGYFHAMNIPLIKGRYLTDQDSESTEPVAVISQRVADTFFRGEDPLGKRVLSVNDASREEFSQFEKWPKIVGVVGDVRHFGLENRTSADLYVCYAQRPRRIGDMIVTVRASGEPASLAAALRQEVKALDANLPLSFEVMEEVFARSTANRRYNVILLGAFAALALALAVIGVYGVTSYAVTQSAKEIGIRLALGAQTRDVLKLVVGQGMVLTALGVGAGLASAFALTRLMTTLLFSVEATDPATFMLAPLLLAGVALVSCYVPAWRATKVDPLVALRHE
ncbi:MAG TPA: ABC transporter permease [Blastocatellia bacterium]|nr:ABC transporter permease [Blastocatellia bacterium]